MREVCILLPTTQMYVNEILVLHMYIRIGPTPSVPAYPCLFAIKRQLKLEVKFHFMGLLSKQVQQ
jgi:hypothetical protein